MDEVQVRTRKSIESAPKVNVNTPNVPDANGQTPSDRLFQFIEEQIGKIRSYTDLGNGMVGFYELNRSIMDFSDINLSLVALDVQAKQEQLEANDNFDRFVDEKLLEARSILNPPSLAGSKYASARELEAYYRSKYRDEYYKLKAEKDAADMKVAVIRRFLDNMESYKFALGTLSKNVQVEAMHLNATDAFGGI